MGALAPDDAAVCLPEVAHSTRSISALRGRGPGEIRNREVAVGDHAKLLAVQWNPHGDPPGVLIEPLGVIIADTPCRRPVTRSASLM